MSTPGYGNDNPSEASGRTLSGPLLPSDHKMHIMRNYNVWTSVSVVKLNVTWCEKSLFHFFYHLNVIFPGLPVNILLLIPVLFLDISTFPIEKSIIICTVYFVEVRLTILYHLYEHIPRSSYALSYDNKLILSNFQHY